MQSSRLIATSCLAAFGMAAFAAAQTAPTLPTTPISVNLDKPCKGASGTQPTTDNETIVGSWDPATGTLSITTTMNACKDAHGAVHNGTDVMSGTLIAGKNPGDYAINTTEQINTTISYANDGGTLTRTCTITHQGTYTGATDTFDGTTTRNNCSLQGSYRELDTRHEIRLLDNLFKRGTAAEAP